MVAKREDLSVLDERVLEALTQSRTTSGVVALAADLWKGPGHGWGADPVGLVHSLVADLAEQGLVSYRVHDRYASGENHTPYSGLPYDIRLTPAGWALMGYPVLHYQVGTHLATSMRLDKKGDRTNFRKHSTTAEGVGPIEVDDFPTHRATYPHHVHMYEDDNEMAQHSMSRIYTKVTPEMEARVLATRALYPTTSYGDLAEQIDLPKRTVEYILTDLPRLRRSADGDAPKAGTLKQRILWTLDVLEVEDPPTLRRILGRADTDHDIVHVLHDLHKQGWVDFTESGAGKVPTHIHLTARGRGQGLPKAQRDEPEVEEENPLRLDNLDGTTGVTVTDLAQPEGYPLLDALLAREGKRIDGDNKAMRYMEAAEVLKDIDPESYASLMERAEQNSNIPFPSPIESEYLRYVAAHTKEVATD